MRISNIQSSVLIRLCGSVVVFACLSLTGCSSAPVYDNFDKVPPPPAVPIHDGAIKPGQRIGPISVGMTATQLLQALGEPDRSEIYTARDGRPMEKMYFGALEVHMPVQSPQRVTSITTQSGSYALEGIAHVGSSPLTFSSLLGPADTVIRDLWCYSSGLAVTFENGVATAMIVQTPGC